MAWNYTEIEHALRFWESELRKAWREYRRTRGRTQRNWARECVHQIRHWEKYEKGFQVEGEKT